MPTIRFAGTITAKAPIMITRPEQGDALLTMHVVRNQALVRAHVITGETIKGLLRALAYAVCVDAARQADDLTVSLASFYTQTAGGVAFSAETRELGAERRLRNRQPLLSLFGAATPRVTGTLYVGHAIAQPTANSTEPEGLGLPPGTRRDGLLAMPEMATLLSEDDKAKWGRQSRVVSEFSEATRKAEDARRALGRARRTPDVDVAPFETALAEAQAAAAAIREAPDFQHSVQRPVPVKRAAPAGTVYEHEMTVDNGSPTEVGLLLAALEALNKLPRIGGGRTTGYGAITAEYALSVLSGTGLRRDKQWEPAGQLTVGQEGSACRSAHPEIVAAMEAWRAVEASIRTATEVFA